MERLGKPAIPRGVGFVEGVVEDVAVAVEVLAILGDLEEGIGGEHAAELGIVQAVDNENFGIKRKGRSSHEDAKV